MKLLYISNHRFPTEKAHGLQIAKMAEAFLEAGVDITLAVPSRKQTEHVNTESAQDFYGLNHEIPVKRFWCIDFLTSRFVPRRLAYALQSFSFAMSIRRFLQQKPQHVLYTRTLMPFYRSLKTPWFYEAHLFPKTRQGQRYQRWLLRHSKGVVCISEGLLEKYKRLLPRKVPLLLAHDGVDFEKFSRAGAETRGKLGLKSVKKLAMYLGSPYKMKGVFTLADATKSMDKVQPVFVGGNAEEPQFKTLKHYAAHGRVIPYVPYPLVPDYLAAADVLVIPNSAKDPMSREESSPLKLFEYMATGKKIVASDVPALKRVLREDTAWFFKADDPKDLGRALKEALDSKEKRGEAAQKLAAHYSWDKRAKAILKFILPRI